MKRSELTVGAKLAWSRNEEWDSPIEVTVLAVEPHEKNPYSRRGAIRPCTKGNGVRVSKVGFDNEPYEALVQLAQLRGPYAEYKAAWEARRETERNAARRERQAREAADERAERLATALGMAGIKAYRSYDGHGTLVISADEAEKILRMIAETAP